SPRLVLFFPYTTLFRSVGGMLFGFVSMNVFLMIQVSAYAIAVLLESTMNFKLYTVRAERAVGEATKTMLTEMKEGFSYLKSNRRSEEHTSELQSRENLV